MDMPTCYLPAIRFSHVFNSCPFEKVKVVILGQDPYPNPRSVLWSLLFRTERSSHSRFSGKHIQGNTSGLGKAHSDFRKSGPLGSARRVSYESVLTVRAHETARTGTWDGKSSQTLLSRN